MSKKVFINLIILLLMLLPSCSSPIKEPSLTPSSVLPSITASRKTLPPVTPTPTPTPTSLLSATPFPPTMAPATATAFPSDTPPVLNTWRDEQNGYGVQYPADWHPEPPSVPGRVRFGGPSSFFEVEGIFLGTAEDVDRVSLWYYYQNPDSCYGPIPANSPAIGPSQPCPTQPINQTPMPFFKNDYCFAHLQKCAIIETNGLNPRFFQLHGAEAQQRYLIFPFELPTPTPPSPTGLPNAFTPTPVQPTAAIFPAFTIEELPFEAAKSKESPDMVSEVTERLPDAFALFGYNEETRLARTNTALAPFGYRLEASCTNCSQNPRYRFIHGAEILKEGVTYFGSVSVSANKADFALLLMDADGDWLARNGRIDLYNLGQHIYIAPVIAGSHLITLNGTWDYTIESDGVPIYRCSTSSFQGEPEVENLFTFDGHWALETLGTLIVDGDIWNTTKFPAQEIFETHIFDGKLFFFFRRENKIGMYYDGKILPTSYMAIHHYGCCGSAAFNPRSSSNGIAFLAKKNGVWNIVTINLGVSAAP